MLWYSSKPSYPPYVFNNINSQTFSGNIIVFIFFFSFSNIVDDVTNSPELDVHSDEEDINRKDMFFAKVWLQYFKLLFVEMLS